MPCCRLVAAAVTATATAAATAATTAAATAAVGGVYAVQAYAARGAASAAAALEPFLQEVVRFGMQAHASLVGQLPRDLLDIRQ